MNNPRFIISESGRALSLESAGQIHALSPILLREFSNAPEYLDSISQQRLFATHSIDGNLQFSKISAAGEQVNVTFSDGYQQIFEPVPLAYAFDRHNGCPEKQFFSGDIIPKFAVASPIEEVFGFFLRYGFAIIEDLGTDVDAMEPYLTGLGLQLRTTNFGRFFDVRTQPEANDLAYTTVSIGPHTDNPYRDPVPTIQCLHCICNNATGGESTLMDSVQAIAVMKEDAPDYVDLLATVPVKYWFVDQGAELIEWRTIFERDIFGEIGIINYSPRLDYSAPLPPDDYRQFHLARQYLNKLLNSPEMELRFKLKSGEMVIFDNRRMLHGRTEFDPQSGERFLRGCYVDIDAVRSVYRIARKKMREVAA